jgi:GT2 family glycosyltransferase
MTVFYGGNFAVRREALDRIGGFDTSIEFHGEDTNLGRRLFAIGKVGLFHDCFLHAVLEGAVERHAESRRAWSDAARLYSADCPWPEALEPLYRGYRQLRAWPVPARPRRTPAPAPSSSCRLP